MSKLDRLLFFGVWGAVIGIALYYGFHFFRGLTGQLMIALGQALIDPYSSYLGASTVLLNLAHTVIAGTPIVVVASIFISLVLKERRLVYGVVPSLVFLVLSYKDLLWSGQFGGYGMDASYYVWRTVDPALFVALFIFTYWLLGLLFAPNKAPQPTQ